MTADAIIGGCLLLPDVRREAATLVGVALQATIPEIGHPFLRCRKYVRIVTGDAPESTLAGAVATTVVHLLGLTGELVRSGACLRDEHRPEAIKLETGPKVLASSIHARSVSGRSSGIARTRHRVGTVANPPD